MVHHERDREYGDCSKNKRRHHSRERGYKKTKKSKLYQSDGECEKHELGYSEISDRDARNKKDSRKAADCRNERDSQAREHRYDPKNKMNSDSECRTYSKEEKRSKKSDKRSYSRKEYASEEYNSDYYASSKVRDKNGDRDSRSRKEKRYEKYHSEDNHGNSESYHRDSWSNRHVSGDGTHYLSNKENWNSEPARYTRKDKYSNSDSYNSSRKRNEVKHKRDHGYSRIKVDHGRCDVASGERESFNTRRGNTHYNRRAETFSQNARNLEKRKTSADYDMHNEKDKEANPNNAKATKKMISGVYIPPAKSRLMQQEITDKGSLEYQQIAWEALKKSINGLTKKINTSNIVDIVKELFKENIIRGRGVLIRALMQAQALSPTFTHVYSALVAVINTKFSKISELLLKRLILQFRRGFRRNDKQACLSSVRFMAHLLNQQVAHEVLILEVLTHLLEHPTDSSVEVAIAMLKECGKQLGELSKKGCNTIFSRLRHVLHEGSLDERTQHMIEVLFAIRKDKFKDFPSVVNELDLVEENDKFTHLVMLDEAIDAEEELNEFKFDPDYVSNEERYKKLSKEILADSESEDSGESETEDTDSDKGNEGGETQKIVDMTESKLVALRRNVYLTIQSSLDFEECAHKLLKMDWKTGGEIMEMCYMILDCCAEQRTYEKFYALLAQRFCQLNKLYLELFMEIFRNSYETIYRLKTNKLRNVAKLFAHLLYTDAIHWNVLSNIKLNENDSTSSGRIFIKILFQELHENMGLPLLNERVKDVTLKEAFDGLFPRDTRDNMKFAIIFFTAIGLGGLTDELQEHLKTAPKTPAAMIQTINEKPAESSFEDSSDDSSASSSSESDFEDEVQQRKRRKTYNRSSQK